MRRLHAVRVRPLALSLGLLVLAACSAPPKAAKVGGVGALAHAVFFDLTDASESGALISDCRRSLSAIPGVQLLEAGARCPEFTGPRNAQDFDVAVWVLFDDRSAHDAYQLHPQHRALVERWTPKLAGVQVFDAYVAE